MARVMMIAALVCAMGSPLIAQDTRPLSPTRTAAAQVLGKYVNEAEALPHVVEQPKDLRM